MSRRQRSNEPPPASYERPAPSLVAVSSPAPSPPAPPQRLCLTGGLTEGMGPEEPRTDTVDADVLLPFEYKGVRLAPSAGLAWRTTRIAATWDEVSLHSGRRAAARRAPASVGWISSAARSLSAYSIGGVNPNAGYLFGAEALARLSVPLSRHVRLVVATRAHAYANRVRVRYPDGRGLRDAAVGAVARHRPRLGLAVVTRASTVPIRRPSAAAEAAEDARLVAAAEGGDRGAFDKLYRRHLDSVYARLTRVIGPAPERDDLVQQIFLDVYRAHAPLSR